MPQRCLMDSGWQVRAELELPDAPTIATLPSGWRWSDTCFWVVNSDGVANDPQRRLVRRGGQLNTAAYSSAAELGQACAPLLRDLSPRPNYRAELRIQVRVPGLSQDMPLLKQLCDYTSTFLPPLWPRLDPLDRLLDGQADGLAAKAAHARLTATIRARHFLLTGHRHKMRMNAATVEEFTGVDAASRPGGRPVYLAPGREAVDVRDVATDDWVTFRHFAGTGETGEVEAAAGFAARWIQAAFDSASATRLAAQFEGWLPRQLPFSHWLEQGWMATNFHHHSRRTVSARLALAGLAC